MSELKETNNPLKDVAQSELGKTVEKGAFNSSEIDNALNEHDKLSDEELNKPIDNIVGGERASLDCRSECKYHTGETYKYADYGYSD